MVVAVVVAVVGWEGKWGGGLPHCCVTRLVLLLYSTAGQTCRPIFGVSILTFCQHFSCALIWLILQPIEVQHTSSPMNLFARQLLPWQLKVVAGWKRKCTDEWLQHSSSFPFSPLSHLLKSRTLKIATWLTERFAMNAWSMKILCQIQFGKLPRKKWMMEKLCVCVCFVCSHSVLFYHLPNTVDSFWPLVLVVSTFGHSSWPCFSQLSHCSSSRAAWLIGRQWRWQCTSSIVAGTLFFYLVSFSKEW